MSEWKAFFELEPFGEDAEWMRAAMIAATIANVHRGKNRAAYKVQDFMPKPVEVREGGKQSVEEQKRVLLGLVRSVKHKAGLTREP